MAIARKIPALLALVSDDLRSILGEKISSGSNKGDGTTQRNVKDRSEKSVGFARVDHRFSKTSMESELCFKFGRVRQVPWQ